MEVRLFTYFAYVTSPPHRHIAIAPAPTPVLLLLYPVTS